MFRAYNLRFRLEGFRVERGSTSWHHDGPPRKYVKPYFQKVVQVPSRYSYGYDFEADFLKPQLVPNPEPKPRPSHPDEHRSL